MATFRRIEEIVAWQRARELARRIYFHFGKEAFARDFALRDQIRKAAISALSNIAEGFEREGKREFIQFLAIAKGSIGEIKSQLYIARDQGFIDDGDFERLFELTDEVCRTVAGLMTYLRSSPTRGGKYSAARTGNRKLGTGNS